MKTLIIFAVIAGFFIGLWPGQSLAYLSDGGEVLILKHQYALYGACFWSVQGPGGVVDSGALPQGVSRGETAEVPSLYCWDGMLQAGAHSKVLVRQIWLPWAMG